MILSSSILSCDLLNIEKELKRIEEAGASWIHVDVMDGHFVPNLTFGLPLIKLLKKRTSLPLDVHIMITNPDEMVVKYLDAGADILTFHLEAAKDPAEIIQKIKKAHKKASIALNPKTEVSLLKPYIKGLNMVLIMGVNPGFSGQAFIPIYHKISELKKLAELENKDLLIAVDGGVDLTNIGKLKESGARVFVSGSFLFQSNDMKEAVSKLKEAYDDGSLQPW